MTLRVLAVGAGLTLASSSSFAHGIYASVIKGGEASEKQKVRVARVAAVAIGAVAIVLSSYAQNLNVAFLIALAFAVAAAGNLPAIYGGLGAAIVLVIFSPVVAGKVTPGVNGAPCCPRSTTPRSTPRWRSGR